MIITNSMILWIQRHCRIDVIAYNTFSRKEGIRKQAPVPYSVVAFCQTRDKSPNFSSDTHIDLTTDRNSTARRCWRRCRLWT